MTSPDIAGSSEVAADQHTWSYAIMVRGTLRTSPIEGAAVRYWGDDTVIKVEIVDQSHLQGVLDQLSNVGLELISVNPSA